MIKLTFASLLVLFAVVYPAEVGAQQYHHNVTWGRLALADTINGKLRWELFIQQRRQNREPGSLNALQALQFVGYQPWLHYQHSPSTRVSLSPISYFDSHLLIVESLDEFKPSFREWRVAVRLDQRQTYRYFTTLTRYTIERRWRDLGHNNVFLPNWRIRYLLQLEKPLKANWIKKPLSIVVSNETFVQFGRAVKGNPNVFDQNRLYAGFTYSLSRNVKTSLGYMYWFQQRPSGKEFDHSNLVWGVLSLENVFSQFKK